MERDRRPRVDGLQEETEHAGPSSQGSAFNSYGSADQFNAPDGTINNSTGSGNHFTGAKFSGPVYFGKNRGFRQYGDSQLTYRSGTKEHFNPLRECLRSLAFPEMDSRLNDIDAAAKGTCKWLLLHKTYKSWTSCDRGLLWIKGKPGSGKSTLLRYALNNVTEILNIRESALVLSFFFHGRGSELQKTPLGLFRSVLHQLLLQVPEALTDLVDTFQQRCENAGKPGKQWQWHPRELQRFFESSLLKVLETRPLWLFVDALDECGEENARKLAKEFKSLLDSHSPTDLKEFRICFTCRHYPILDLDGVFKICVEEENKRDISTFVQDKLSLFRERTSSMIPDLITNRADGVFLWAWLMVNQVLDLELEGTGLKEIEATILSVPQELDNLYRELIRNLGPDSLKLIQWVCFATRPLTLDELRWALVIEIDCPHQSLYECQSAGDYTSDDERMQRRVQTLSRGLAEVTSDAKVVQFIHQSVKDFFVEKGLSALDENAKTDLVVGIAHHRLSRACIRYLAMLEIGRSASHEPYSWRSKFPFLHYAMASWVTHVRQSDARSVPQEDLLEYFAGPSNALMERWVRVYRILGTYSDDYPLEGTSLVHVMSRYGVAGALGAILERADQVGINIDAKDSDGRTPLSWAASGGHEVVVQILLKTGKFDIARWPKVIVRLLLLVTGKVNVDTKDWNGRRPLSYAAENGHEAVVRLLLDRGARTEAAHNEGRTPLSYAAANGHEAVVRLLLDRGARTEAADMWGQTPLARASEKGHEAVVRLLLDGGAHTNAADKDGWTPLLWAAKNGHEAVVRLLLDGGAHTNAADKDGWTPLLWAAKNGDEAVVRLLLDGGAHTEAAGNEGRTPLSYAAENGDETVVRLLLDRNAHTEAAGNEGRTPLSYAAENGHEAVVRLLLDGGAHTNAADKDGWTPLLWAAKNGDEAVVRLLLDRNAHTEAAGNEGRTPLSYAAENGDEAVVRLLLDGGAHTNAADKDGWTPLLWAAKNGDEAVVRLLLDGGAHTEAAGNEGRTPLSYAAENGDETVVRLLLDRNAHTNAADKDGWTPLLWALLWAAKNGDETVVRLLLDGGAHTEVADMWGRTPLARASEKGHEAIMRLLLDGGAHTEVADMWGRTPLARASEKGHEAIMRLLLERGANTEAADMWGRTPLARASEKGHEAIMRLLLERGANTEAVDKEGRTPLLSAAAGGHEAVVRLLQVHIAQPSSTTLR
ncbi:hypothetical protein FALCPG4_014865 [Fusarium falciforme]